MDRKRRILNFVENGMNVKLKKAVRESGSQIFSKIRIADVLEIDHSGITDEEYRFALRAHFDFVISSSDTTPLFAVEFDGVGHEKRMQVSRDHIKNKICEKLKFPILRIDKTTFHQKIDNTDILIWLVELWFLYEEWLENQRQGNIPLDEDFSYFSVINFDPFSKIHNRIVRSIDKKKIESRFFHAIQKLPEGYIKAVAAYEVKNDKWIIAHSRCRSFQYPPISSIELALELATVSADRFIQDYLSGLRIPLDRKKIKPYTNNPWQVRASCL